MVIVNDTGVPCYILQPDWFFLLLVIIHIKVLYVVKKVAYRKHHFVIFLSV